MSSLQKYKWEKINGTKSFDEQAVLVNNRYIVCICICFETKFQLIEKINMIPWKTMIGNIIWSLLLTTNLVEDGQYATPDLTSMQGDETILHGIETKERNTWTGP